MTVQMTYSDRVQTPPAETMSLSDELDSLRASFAACETIAFADLSSRMVLMTSSERKLRQEALDAVSVLLPAGSKTSPVTVAVLVAATQAPPVNCTVIMQVSDAPKGGEPIFSRDDGADTAIFATHDGVDVFLRATSEPTDVLCCRCGADIDVAAFVTEARTQLEKISGGTGS